MVILTIVCDRCSKEIEEDLSNNTSCNVEDQARKAGFQHVHANRKNMLICGGCFNQFQELKDIQEEKAYKEVCKFFKSCGKEENGDPGENENG